MEKCGKRGKKYFFPYFFFILLKTNTNDAHMQNFIQIPEKMKTGVQNVLKWVKCTIPLEQGFFRYVFFLPASEYS